MTSGYKERIQNLFGNMDVYVFKPSMPNPRECSGL